MTIWVVPTADRGCGTGGHIARPYGRGDGGTVGAACMAARGGLAVSASLRWNEVRHGRAYSPPLRWGTFGGGASDAAVRRGRLIAAPTGLLSGYSLGQGLFYLWPMALGSNSLPPSVWPCIQNAPPTLEARAGCGQLHIPCCFIARQYGRVIRIRSCQKFS